MVKNINLTLTQWNRSRLVLQNMTVCSAATTTNIFNKYSTILKLLLLARSNLNFSETIKKNKGGTKKYRALSICWADAIWFLPHYVQIYF
jgi:hypothetical protein